MSTFSKCQTCGKMQLMGTGVECVWCEGERAAMKPSKDEQIATLTRDLTAAIATVEKCKQAAENAIDHAENAMEQGDADEAWARCNAGLRAVVAAAKGGGE